METVENILEKAWKNLMNAQNTLAQVKFEIEVKETVQDLEDKTNWICNHG